MRHFEGAVQNQPVDVSGSRGKQENHLFLPQGIVEFDPGSASGRIR